MLDAVGDGALRLTLAVAGVSPVDAWAVGTGGAIMHWDGSFWQSVASPTTTSLAAVTMVSAIDGWAVGAQGVMFPWNGVAWRQVDSPTTEYLTSSLLLPPLLSPSPLPSSLSFPLSPPLLPSPSFPVDMVSSIDGWAVGMHGVILRWDGVDWSQVDAQVQRDLYGVDMVSATDGWIVGEENTILHWDGQTWTAVSASWPPASIHFTTP